LYKRIRLTSSEFPGFFKLTPEKRLRFIAEFAHLDKRELLILRSSSPLKVDTADRMIENVVGLMPVPLGVAVNFLINGKDRLIPMAIEEPSVVAGASHAAKMARSKGGFWTSSTPPVMIGQIQVVECADPDRARASILASTKEILGKANEQDPVLVSKGGGAVGLEAKVIKTILWPMVVAELLVNCGDAMGANAVNTMAEAVAPLIERVTGGHVYLRIISNLADKRLARARVTVAKEAVGGAEVVDGIINAYAFAAADPYRCATHNKGVMNGITAVVLATGNDTRAIEAGAHAYAARSGQYSPLTRWSKSAEGDLVGEIEVPMAVGLIGGATAVHPVAKVAVKILGVKSARELAETIAAVGLCQNLAALRALAAEGIQRGHMRLHARNLAATAGATGDLIDKIALKMVGERKIRIDRAKELLAEYSKSS
jgi:hydroxymethylglutaryl-CoA reductase